MNEFVDLFFKSQGLFTLLFRLYLKIKITSFTSNKANNFLTNFVINFDVNLSVFQKHHRLVFEVSLCLREFLSILRRKLTFNSYKDNIRKLSSDANVAILVTTSSQRKLSGIVFCPVGFLYNYRIFKINTLNRNRNKNHLRYVFKIICYNHWNN